MIWWLLRFTPPRPRRQAFPPTRILAELMLRDETRARSPLWLTILRMTIAALVIFAMAGPVLNPPTVQVATGGPLIVVIDSGWASSPQRDAMRETAGNAIEAAERPVNLSSSQQPPPPIPIRPPARSIRRCA
ncbi:MAG: BatA domain-containing protein [Tepidamorphaceae bacterium]